MTAARGAVTSACSVKFLPKRIGCRRVAKYSVLMTVGSHCRANSPRETGLPSISKLTLPGPEATPPRLNGKFEASAAEGRERKAPVLLEHPQTIADVLKRVFPETCAGFRRFRLIGFHD